MKLKLFLILYLIFFSFNMLYSIGIPGGIQAKLLLKKINPISMKLDKTGRIYICNKEGKILVYNTSLNSTRILLDITTIVDSEDERGLQSMVFDPNFDTNGYIYIFFALQTEVESKSNVVYRYTIQNDSIDINTAKRILKLDDFYSSAGHNGGGLLFDRDGKLLITCGDAGNAVWSQNFRALHGKVLRINSDGSIPEDNPYFDSVYVKTKMIYAMGLRNPFKIIADKSLQNIFIHDVGLSTYEEIDKLSRSANFGWPVTEGFVTTVNIVNYQNPIHVYNHTIGCAITGGLFYEPSNSQIPSSILGIGKYLFADYCNGQITILDTISDIIAPFAKEFNNLVDLQYNPDNGKIYVLARNNIYVENVNGNTVTNNGELWELSFNNIYTPNFTIEPQNKTIPKGGTYSTTVQANGNQPITYRWYANDTIIENQSGSTLYLPNLSLINDSTTIKVMALNDLDSTISNLALIHVVNNHAPIPKILIPDSLTTHYIAGQIISFSGEAFDEEDGFLNTLNLTWEVNFHHNDHTHPVLDPLVIDQFGTISSSKFRIPDLGETSTNVFYRIFLTAEDSQGESNTSYKDLFPSLSNMIINTQPSGYNILLDGQITETPTTITSVMGLMRTISATDSITYKNKAFPFQKWSDNFSLLSRTIQPTDPLVNYVAQYSVIEDSTETLITNYPNIQNNSISKLSDGNYKLNLLSSDFFYGVILDAKGSKFQEFINDSIILTNNYPDGLYIIRVFQKNNQFNFKVVNQRKP